ncbi:hypothetical protein PIB30_065008 [Stylosanthes scabra]|uniref:EF-hand domain-containing protein n=1 Tax=Stylosanthes scabra TaxID=79078 RepID=A0ABU6VKF2_9FABA|nr:hypothetical protein [Stylosanthes scabra]
MGQAQLLAQLDHRKKNEKKKISAELTLPAENLSVVLCVGVAVQFTIQELVEFGKASNFRSIGVEKGEMAKRDMPDSDPDDDASASSYGQEDDETEETTLAVATKTVSDYEKQRLSRIAENNARMEALGLHKMASSLKNRKGKGKLKEDEHDDDDHDHEYIPDEDADEPASDDEDDEDEDFVIGNASASRKRKQVKNKGSKMKAKVSGKKLCNSNPEYIDGDDEDEALKQAIALSLQGTAEDFSSKHVVKNITKAEKKRNTQNQEDKERKKNKKSFASRLQMTEDELIGHFFQLDEADKGTVSMRDLQRAAIAHDFSWTDKELVDMIRCFDSDGDGRISLDDFRKIVVRCNLIKGS